MESDVRRQRSRLGHTAEAEALFMSIGDGAIYTDAKARISRINQTALDILGFSENELIGKWFPEAIVAEDEQGNIFPVFERPISQVFLTGNSVSARTFYRRKDGSSVPVFLTVSPVILDSKPIGAVEVFRDISHELALEQAKDEFVAIASHQLRTPATAVKQYVGLLLEGYAEPLTDSQKLFLERAYESNERQLQIVQEILKVTQLDLDKVVLKPEVYDIREIITEAAATVQGRFDAKQQKIIIKNPQNGIYALVDKDQIRIAIENLLENASNYTRNGKKIEVQARKYKDYVRICIIDEGVGIDPRDHSKLFQKFSRVPNPLSVAIGGTGLGLYWADKIVKMHAGEITVDSAVNKGSKFTISLPSGL